MTLSDAGSSAIRDVLYSACDSVGQCSVLFMSPGISLHVLQNLGSGRNLFGIEK